MYSGVGVPLWTFRYTGPGMAKTLPSPWRWKRRERARNRAIKRN